MKQFTLPNGMYNFDDLKTEFENQMVKNGDACSYYYPIEITLYIKTSYVERKLKEGWKVEFNLYGAFGIILGFKNRVVEIQLLSVISTLMFSINKYCKCI